MMIQLLVAIFVLAEFYSADANSSRDFIQEQMDQHTLSGLTVRLEKAIQQYQWSDTSALESLLVGG